MEREADQHERVARVLHSLRMRSTFYCHAELRDPWALEMPAIRDSVSFHVVTAGSCTLRLGGRPASESGESVRLEAGDLALVPHGRGHALLSDPDAGPPVRVEELPQRYVGAHYSELEYGGGGRRSQLICGVVSFDDPSASELVRSLPALIRIDGGEASVASSVRDTLRLMAHELSHPQPGGEAVATRLADILVVQGIRSWLASSGEEARGWLAGVRDDRIGLALQAMHAEPGREWDLAGLATVATMSRTAFSARFADLLGEPPMTYLTRWRMQVARTRLSTGQETSAEVGVSLGYRSEAAFNRAFRRVVGQTPGAYRRVTSRSVLAP